MKNLGLLLIRIVAGMTLVAHGYPKLFGGDGRPAPDLLTNVFGQHFPQQVSEGGPEAVGTHFEQMGLPYPRLGAYLSGATELGGGLALLTGTMTRWAALAVAINMAVAIRKVHWQNGLVGEGGFEYPAQLFAEAASLFLAGPGAFSIDGLFGSFRAGKKAVKRGGEAVGEAAATAKKRGSEALEDLASQARAVPGLR
jgi:putative oxidoreductase